MIEWEASLSLSEELAVARLHDLTTQLISCEDVQSAVNITMDAAIELHQADFGTFQVLRSESHDLEIVAQRGFKEDFLEAFRSVSADDPCACGRALRDQKPIIIKDVIKDNEFTPYREIALEAEYRAVVAMPMVTSTDDQPQQTNISSQRAKPSGEECPDDGSGAFQREHERSNRPFRVCRSFRSEDQGVSPCS